MRLILRSFYRRSFVWMFVFSVALSALVSWLVWESGIPGMAENPLVHAQVAAFFICFGVLEWLVLKNTLSRLWIRHAGEAETPLPSKKQKKKAKTEDREESARPPADDPAIRKNHDQRLFVHLFSELQREGRFMDFLQEDLSLYEDGQIGAAVRSIHENCRKTVDRYLQSEPVMTQAEGETLTVDEGFDPQAVKLVGNVVGEPPFTGILRHRGWKLRRFSLPELSDTGNADIIAPAEVEVT